MEACLTADGRAGVLLLLVQVAVTWASNWLADDRVWRWLLLLGSGGQGRAWSHPLTRRALWNENEGVAVTVSDSAQPV